VQESKGVEQERGSAGEGEECVCRRMGVSSTQVSECVWKCVCRCVCVVGERVCVCVNVCLCVGQTESVSVEDEEKESLGSLL
jgi:hypothetical protein